MIIAKTMEKSDHYPQITRQSKSSLHIIHSNPLFDTGSNEQISTKHLPVLQTCRCVYKQSHNSVDTWEINAFYRWTTPKCQEYPPVKADRYASVSEYEYNNFCRYPTRGRKYRRHCR